MIRNSKCEKCQLHFSAKHVCLWGKGCRKSPEVMFIGEAPGQNEDDTGIPFHPDAKAGGTLRHLIRELGLEKTSYISNIVKCRPPGNRAPKKAEVDACLPFLQSEIRDINPKVIVLLGGTAIKVISGEPHAKIAEKRGLQNWKYEGAQVIATYHPAAVHYPGGEGLWDKIVEDLNRIADRSFRDPAKVQWTYVHKMNPSYLRKHTAFDIETTRLNPWSVGGEVLCVSWSGEKDRAYVTEDIDGFCRAVEKKRCQLIGHNVKFDLLWLWKHHDLTIPDLVDDTLVMAHLTDENRESKSLASLSGIHTGYGPYGGSIKPGREKEGFMKALPKDELHEYCCYDSAATYRIYKDLCQDIRSQGLQKLYDCQMHVLHTIIRMEWHGVHIDRKATDKLERSLNVTIDNLTLGISSVLGDINPDSNQQLGRALFDDLGFAIYRRTKTGPSVDAATLGVLSTNPGSKCRLPMAEAQSLIARILERRKAKKTLKTYVVGIRTKLDRSSYVHPSFNLTGTVTGRTSCNGPNLQNIPRDTNAVVKIIFQAPKGRMLIQADYSQIELRVGALETRDRTMLRSFREGQDLHEQTAWKILGRKPTVEERTHAKIVNFGIFYGMGPKRLMSETGMTMAEAKLFLRAWHDTYPAVQEWQLEKEQELLRNGYVFSLFGRRRRLATEFAGDPQEYKALLRQACNMPIQSAAGELTLMAMALVNDALPAGSWPIINVHDSVIVECREDQVPRVARIMKKTMENATRIVNEFGFHDVVFDVPTPVEIKYGSSWYKMKELVSCG